MLNLYYFPYFMNGFVSKLLGIVIGWLGIIFHCFFIGELFNQLEINNGGLYVFLAYCILLIMISYLCIRATKAVIFEMFIYIRIQN